MLVAPVLHRDIDFKFCIAKQREFLSILVQSSPLIVVYSLNVLDVFEELIGHFPERTHIYFKFKFMLPYQPLSSGNLL